MKRSILFSIVLLCAGASGCGGKGDAESPPKKEGVDETTPSLPTPVRVGVVAKRSLAVYVSGPGKTAALSQQKVRAPFAGTLTELRVTDGDRVGKGQVLGTMVARESEAALSGAREMLRQASTAAERSDAERAVALAEKNLVRRALTAAWEGAVLAHAASAGDRLSEDQEILTIADAGSIVFLADVPQADLPRIRPGQKATLEIAGSPSEVSGIVHAILPGANPADFTGSVRIDLPSSASRVALGIFGTAHVLVSERLDANVVPSAAVLRDDVSGIARLALVSQNRAHWITVQTGLSQADRTEILSPALAVGQVVIISGLVGLPEGQPVRIEP